MQVNQQEVIGEVTLGNGKWTAFMSCFSSPSTVLGKKREAERKEENETRGRSEEGDMRRRGRGRRKGVSTTYVAKEVSMCLWF